MKASLEWLLGGSIDYAGIFPPASLSLDDAARKYANHRSGSESWIVNRFVCPVDKLSNLTKLIPFAGEPWSVSALGSGMTTLKEDLELIHAFHSAIEGRAEVECYEVKADGPLKLGRALSQIASEIGACYVELPWDDSMPDAIHALAQTEGVNAKARCGGATAAAYPSAEELAMFLKECIDLDLAFKLTAGLHHALPQRDNQSGGEMHGFLNVFIATALCGEYDLSAGEVADILRVADRGAFQFGRESIEYEEMEIDHEAIEDCRVLFESYGSCSISEPIEDLEKLGLVAAGVSA